ncbi:MAG TPA: rod shape-determining protein MreD [Bacteroidales bacterium]
MNNAFFKNIIRFVLLITVQVLLLNNINLGGYLNPAVYILFILLLPTDINKSLLLILSFITGYSIDIFTNTPGLNAAATVMMAFVMPAMRNTFFKNIDFSPGEEPNLKKVGLGSFARYTLVLVFIHHFTLFFLEAFSFSLFFFTLVRIMLGTLLSTLIILIIMLLFSPRKT